MTLAPEPSIIRSTLRALLQPRRLIPVLLVSVSLVIAQGSFSRDPFAVPLGIVMCALFVVVAPVSWRVLFPERVDFRHGGVRVLLYGAIGAGVVSTVGVMLPRALGMGRTLLTAPSSVLVCLALFLVGGWGLARDIWFERTLARAQAQVAGLAREAERAQLMALRAHLDPHFLFNTLNAIAEWCREDGETAERAVLQLSAMLRTVLVGVQAETWPLGDELALAETLFALHRLRDPDAFQLVRRVPEPLPEVSVPPLLLLPLAENAVKHGPASGHRGEIVVDVQVSLEDARLVFSLSNPGRYAGRRDGGTGLETVERRLALAYDGQAMLKIAGLGHSGAPGQSGAPAGERTVVEVTLPLAGPITGAGA